MKDIERVVVGSGVTSLEDGLFKDLTKLREVDFSNCNKSLQIPKECFSGCISLQQCIYPGAGGDSPIPPEPPPTPTTINWYVNAAVKASGDGRSLETAFKTIQEAIAVLDDNQSIFIEDGIYDIFKEIEIVKSNVTFIGRSKENTILNGLGSKYIVFGGKCMILKGHNYTFERLKIQNFITSDYTIEGDGAIINTLRQDRNVTFKDVWFKDCSNIRNNNYYAPVICYCCQMYRCLVEHCRSHNSLVDGLTNSNSYDCIVLNCYGTYNIGALCKNMYNCTVINTNGDEYRADGYGIGNAYNCLFVNTIRSYIKTNGGSSNIRQNNAFFGFIQKDYTWNNSVELETNPIADISNRDFNLQSSAKCINAGDNKYVNGDIDYYSRPRIVNGTVDCGACEFQG